MSFSIGIVGLPNVGKSTLFSAITQKQVDISNYPFCTISPNVGVVAVPDMRLKQIAKIIKPQKVTPTIIEFIDIAGLVSGAHKGEGLGNQFLSHIKECEAIIHLIRVFEDPNVSHIEGEIKPLYDIKIVSSELLAADWLLLEKQIEKFRPKARSGDKISQERFALLEKIKKELEKNKPVRSMELSKEEKEATKEFQFLTEKPVLYVANISENQMGKELDLPIKPLLPINCKLELELESFNEEEKKEYLESYGLKRSQLDLLILECYKLLDFITFYTVAGGEEIRAWTLTSGKTAYDAAGCVHTDFQEKFIKAEVVTFSDFVKACSEAAAREQGKIKTVGKECVVQDGDIMRFKI